MSVGAESGGSGRPKFRDNLVAQPVEDAGIKWVEVSDPGSGRSFRFYDFEYLVASSMDGTRDAGDLVLHARQELGFETTPADLMQFVTELERLGYVTRAVPVDDAMDPHEAATGVVDADELRRRAIESTKVPERPAMRPPTLPMAAPPPGSDETSFEGLVEQTANKPNPLAGKALDWKPGSEDTGGVTPLPAPQPLGGDSREQSQSGMRIGAAGLEDETTATRDMGGRVSQKATLPGGASVIDAATDNLVKELSPPIATVSDPVPTPPAAPALRIAEPKFEPPKPPATSPRDGSERMMLPPKQQPKAAPPKPVAPLPTPEEPRKSSALLLFLLLILVGAGAAVYYFKVLKKKPAGTKTPVASPTPTAQPSPTPTTPPAPKLEKVAASTRPDPANLHTETAVLVATGGGDTGNAKIGGDGKVNWIAKDGTEVAVGDVVCKLAGWTGLESRVKDRAKSLKEKNEKMDKIKAEEPPDPKAMASQQKEIDRVAGELAEVQKKYDAVIAKATVAGPTKALVKTGDSVTFGQDVVQIGGGPPAVRAVFELGERDRYKVGEPATLMLDGKAIAGVVDAVDGNKINVRVADTVQPLPAAGGTVALLKSDADPSKGLIVIPAAALHGDYVWVVKDGKVAKLTVSGKVDGGDAVIDSGLSAGDVVLVGEAKEGDPVP